MRKTSADLKLISISSILFHSSFLISFFGIIIIIFIFYLFYGFLISLCILIIFFAVVLYKAQDCLIYHPNLPANSRIYIAIPTMHNLPHETVNIHTPDKVTLHAYWIKQLNETSKTVPTIVYFHGNAGNMGQRMQNVWGIYYNLNCNVLMVEYRGYGLSNGSPSELGLGIDGRAAVDYLFTRDDLNHNQIILFGRSLGGAVAIDVSSDPNYNKRIMCTIVENTFTSIPLLSIEIIHPYLKYFPDCFYKNRFDSINKIQNVTNSSLFVSGLADLLVPPNMMRSLYNKCGSKKKHLIELIGGTHNDTWVIEGYYQSIKNFLDDCRNEPEPLLKPPQVSNIWTDIQEV